MSMKCREIIPGTLVVLGALFVAGLTGPAAYAGDPVILVPADDRDVPEGSQIPDRRVYEIEEKVEAYKAKMRQRQAQGLEGLPQKETSKPNGEQ